ncbi:MAG: class II aldolase/adducin family protein [Alphaproteobacteria bacterium]
MIGTIKERQSLIDICLKMNETGINSGSSGNASIKIKEGFLITPSGLAYSKTKPEDIVYMDDDSKYYGNLLPSSEWHFHLAIQKKRKDINAVLHAHAPWSMVVASCLKDLPAVHYMIGVAKTNVIKCSPYEPFGSKELSTVALEALGDEASACLLGNHGIITVGQSLEQALYVMQEVEQLARIYVLSQNLGGANILSDNDMEDIHKRFKTYGKQPDQMSKDDIPAVIPPQKGD